ERDIVIVDREADGMASDNELAPCALAAILGLEDVPADSGHHSGLGENLVRRAALPCKRCEAGRGDDDTGAAIVALAAPVVELCNAACLLGHTVSIRPALKLSSHSSIVGRSPTGTMLAASWKRIRSVGASRRIAS